MMMEDLHQQISTEITKATPAVAGTVGALLTSNEMLTIATICYVVIQAAYLVRKWWREEKAALIEQEKEAL